MHHTGPIELGPPATKKPRLVSVIAKAPPSQKPLMHGVARNALGFTEKVLLSGQKGDSVCKPFKSKRHPAYHTCSDNNVKRSYSEKLEDYSAGGQEFLSNLTLQDVFFEEGRSPVIEIAYEEYDHRGLYQFLVRPSFGTVTAKALVVLLARVSQANRGRLLIISGQQGVRQNAEVMRFFRTVLPDKYGLHPADIESGQYFPNARKQSGNPVKETQTEVSETVDACTQSSDTPALRTQAVMSETRRKVVIGDPGATAKLEQLTIEERLKRYGCYPLLPAGRRAWSSTSGLNINIGLAGTMTWPPLGWVELTPNNKLWAAQTVISLREMRRNNGFFPDGDVAEYLDKYKSLILPGTTKMRREGPAAIRLCQNSRDLLATLMHGMISSDMMSMGNAEVLEGFSSIISGLATRDNFHKCIGGDLALALETVPVADMEYDEDEETSKNST